MIDAAIFPEPARVNCFSLPRSGAHDTIKRSRGKTVSWPSQDKICQVRFFLTEDSPSTVGSAQHVLQWSFVGKSIMKTVSPCETLDLPPGFHGSLPKRSKLSHLAEPSLALQAPWYPPHKFVMDSSWWVTEGGESKEVAVQHQREIRVLEAFYPRCSCIPDCPAEPSECCDYSGISLPSAVPIIPLDEDSESAEEAECPSKSLDKDDHGGVVTLELESKVDVESCEPSLLSKGISMPPQLDGKAARDACVSLVSGLVDQELLVEIIHNPTLLRKLMSVKQPDKDVAKSIIAYQDGISNVDQQLATLSKNSLGFSSSSGLPSPISVLAEWTEAITLKSSLGMPSFHGDRPNKPNVMDVEPHSRSVHPSAMNNLCSMHSKRALKQGFGERGCAGACESRATCKSHTNLPGTSHRHANVPNEAMCPSQPLVTHTELQSALSDVMGSSYDTESALGLVPYANTSLYQHMTTDSRTMLNASSDFSQTSVKSKRLCVYFNTSRGCRKGGNCDFVHQ